jgi:hypothetical protein
MLCKKGAPTDANCVIATGMTSAPNHPSFDQIGQKLAAPGHYNRSHLITSGHQNKETFVENWYKNTTVPQNHIGTMLREQGAHTDADCVNATVITSAQNHSSFEKNGEKLAKFELLNRSYYDTLSAIVTSRGPQKTSCVETYLESWYKNNTVPKTTIKEYKNPRKTGSETPSGPPSLPQKPL